MNPRQTVCGPVPGRRDRFLPRAGDPIYPGIRRGPDPLSLDVDGVGRVALSAPGKMPGYAFGTPAGATCPAARKTVKEYGKLAVCAGCYAKRYNYTRATVRAAYERRAQFIRRSVKLDGGDGAVAGLTYLIGRAVATSGDPVFRVSDSGDLWSPAVCAIWGRVADNLPGVRFWVPTREYLRPAMLPALRELHARPNVVVRPSAAVLGQTAPDVEGLGPGTTVAPAGAAPVGSFPCPATRPGADPTCDGNSCRVCWDDTRPVCYSFHGPGAASLSARLREGAAELAQTRAARHVRDLPTV